MAAAPNLGHDLVFGQDLTLGWFKVCTKLRLSRHEALMWPLAKTSCRDGPCVHEW